MKLLLLRPYYGITISSDMMGDLGNAEYMPYVVPDLPLIYAATIAKNDKSVELDIIDANAEKLLPKDTIKRMKGKYDVIILKAAAPSIKYDIDFAKYLKNNDYTSRIVLAGHTAKLLKGWIRKQVAEIDDISEVPIEHYVSNMLNTGLASLSIDEFPTPDYTLFPYKNYLSHTGEMRGCLNMSRGCAVGCSYCPYASFYGKKFDFRSVDKVIEDIKFMLSLGFKAIQFRDQYFTVNRNMVIELCRKIIDQGLKFDWYCETRLDSLDTGLIDIMVKAGLKFIFFGVESADENTLQSYNRPVFGIEKTKNLIEYLNKNNVLTLAFYMVGFPNDTWDTIQSTYKLAVKMGSIMSDFFIYEPSLTDGEFKTLYPDMEITPDLFVPFENMMNIRVSKNFSLEEVKEFKNLLKFLYEANSDKPNALQEAFEKVYHTRNQYLNTVNSLRKKLEKVSIMDI